MLKEFKAFAMRGNVVDMAVGIIIGVAFGKIITSFVNDILMPPIGMLLGKVDFSNLVITLHEKTASSAAVTIKYGLFINAIIDFAIVAFAMFILITYLSKLMKLNEKPVEPTKKDCPFCCSSIPISASRCPQCTSDLSAKTP
jgi:large conductance mechanosensitive channel